MPHLDSGLLFIILLAFLFVIFKLLSDRKCYATLVEKSVMIEEQSGKQVTRFICIFGLDTGGYVMREVDNGFFNQITVGEVGVVYHRGKRVTGLCFHSRR